MKKALLLLGMIAAGAASGGVVLLQGVVIWGTGCMHDGRQRTEQRGQTTGAQHVFS
jgi:hypothetical protein